MAVQDPSALRHDVFVQGQPALHAQVDDCKPFQARSILF